MKKVISSALLILALAAAVWGFWRGELPRIYLNARAVCYSCIGLE